MKRSLSLLWRRLVAFALDYLVISAYLVALVAMSLLIGLTTAGTRFRALFADHNAAELTAFALLDPRRLGRPGENAYVDCRW
jgi:hypothetical protein